ncbi:hypothetical protein ABNQ38_07680 (plasmid) [Azospirillum sp. A29]|uniref:hypothetical protein n=1 Tax=Azospirillum sp. A29 TaxID=3160606 RepID=UPI00366E2589
MPTEPHVRIHDVRHWFVSQQLQELAKRASGDAGRLKQLRDAFVRYMGWRSGAVMLSTYEHSNTEGEVFQVMNARFQRDRAAEELLATDPTLGKVPYSQTPVSRDMDPLLARIVGGLS